MRAESLRATLVALLFSLLLGSAVAAQSTQLTRGGKRLAEKAEVEERAAFHADSSGRTWPIATHAQEKSGRRAGIKHPDSVAPLEKLASGADVAETTQVDPLAKQRITSTSSEEAIDAEARSSLTEAANVDLERSQDKTRQDKTRQNKDADKTKKADPNILTVTVSSTVVVKPVGAVQPASSATAGPSPAETSAPAMMFSAGHHALGNVWCPSGTELLMASEKKLRNCYAKVGETELVKGYEDCMLVAWDECYMTRCMPDGSWAGLVNARFTKSADSLTLLKECASFCPLEPKKVKAIPKYQVDIRDNSKEFAELIAKQFSPGANAKLRKWVTQSYSPTKDTLKFPFALDVYGESDMTSCYRTGTADSDGSDCVLHWGLLAVWRYLREVPHHQAVLDAPFNITRLTELMGESIVSSVTRAVEILPGRSLVEFARAPEIVKRMFPGFWRGMCDASALPISDEEKLRLAQVAERNAPRPGRLVESSGPSSPVPRGLPPHWTKEEQEESGKWVYKSPDGEHEYEEDMTRGRPYYQKIKGISATTDSWEAPWWGETPW